MRESNNNFRGGELLDAERMSEIKESFLSESAISDTETEKRTEETSEKQTENIIDEESASESENSSHSELQSNEKSEVVSEKSDTESESETEDNYEPNDSDIVYWIKGGGVWHLSDECYHISDKDIISGTVEEAREAGKTKVCSKCRKKFT